MDKSLHPLARALVPPLPGLRVQQITLLTNQLIVRLVSTAPLAYCPTCFTSSSSVHGHYSRSLADLPWGACAVLVLLAVRKFRCSCAACPRRIFSERLPTLVAPYARQTARRQLVLRALSFALGGRPAARLARHLRLPCTRTSLLRLLRQAPLPALAPPRIVGVDDWAFRRGHRYGTIIVDLERHAPIALLPDRQADTLVAWLRLHPSITVISRDRAGAYAEAARRGAPQATQVADRWHLLKNLTDGLEQFVLNKRHVLKTAVLAPAVPAAGTGPGPLPPVRRAAPSAAEVVADQRHARYLDQYQRIQALAAQQIAIATIAQHVEVSRGTVYRYLRLAEPPRRKQPGRRGSSLLAPYEAYLRTRWQEGCRNAKQLGREIQAQGYSYSSTTVERFIGQLRHTLGTARSFRQAAPMAAGDKRVPARPPRPYTARQAALLLTARPDQRSEEQRAYLTRLGAADPEIATTREQVEAFGTILRKRQGPVPGWLAEGGGRTGHARGSALCAGAPSRLWRGAGRIDVAVE